MTIRLFFLSRLILLNGGEEKMLVQDGKSSTRHPVTILKWHADVLAWTIENLK